VVEVADSQAALLYCEQADERSMKMSKVKTGPPVFTFIIESKKDGRREFLPG
jgi:hypothetical protein